MAYQEAVDGNPQRKRLDWIQLTTRKDFSRLLYPNPVCFLSTCDQESRASNDLTSSCNTESDDTECAESGVGPGIDNGPVHDASGVRNVMILSWITPTNNHGRFMFSINRNRYSASLLAPVAVYTDSQTGSNAYSDNFRTGIEFALSVPVKGMEELVLNVGSVSGRFGSKFPTTQSRECDETISTSDMESRQFSNRQRKQRKKEEFSQHGIPGLIPIPPCFSSSSSTSLLRQSLTLFVIRGTVAHLRCRTYAVVGTPSLEAQSKNEKANHCAAQLLAIDKDHLLIMAEVLDAAVHPLYWDKKKSLFRPQSKSESCSAMETEENEVPPYLTFFGSQTFGYVTS